MCSTIQPPQRIRLEQLLIQLVNSRPGPGAHGGCLKGMGGGVGIAEAAGVRGGTHIHRFRNLPVGLHTHQAQHVPDQLRAGRAVGVHQFGISKRRSASMVVDAQGDSSQQGLKRFRQHGR